MADAEVGWCVFVGVEFHLPSHYGFLATYGKQDELYKLENFDR